MIRFDARRFRWLLVHAGCAGLALATSRHNSLVAAPEFAAPPLARWKTVRLDEKRVLVYDVTNRRAVLAPNPLPRLGPVALAPGFDTRFWAMADGHRIKVISLETGEAVANFPAPIGGVDRLAWIDRDRLAVVPKAPTPWLTYRLSTGGNYRSARR